LSAGRRGEDTAARLSGDEFALLLPEIASSHDAALVAGRALASLAEPMRFGTHELIVTASAGVAVWPDDGSDPRRLFGYADAAMYRAKAQGRNRAEAGYSAADKTAAARLRLVGELRHAGRRGELSLRFQPLVTLRDGALLGMEALLRWQHPRLGLLTSGAILPVAAEAGMSAEIDLWVLAQACGQACRWTRGGRQVPVTVNVSEQHFRDLQQTLGSGVARILERTALPPELLILEVSERTVIEDPNPVAQELHRLRALGVGLALDNFGVVHTSLTHLQRLPLRMLKIDRDLVRRAGSDSDELRVLSAVTTLAHILGLTVVAEGIERADQVLALRQIGCDAGQGDIFSPPVDAEAADALVTEHALALSPDLSQPAGS
jgi:EAL domain-containing protein (putative c-di-GMP-specific phosphodiesterase class I)